MSRGRVMLSASLASLAMLAMLVCAALVQVSYSTYPTSLLPASAPRPHSLELQPVTPEHVVETEPALPPGVTVPMFEEPAENEEGSEPSAAPNPVTPATGDGVEIRTPPLAGEVEKAVSPIIDVAEKMWEEIQARESELQIGEEELERKKIEFEEMERQFKMEMEQTGNENAEQAELLIEAAKEIAEHARDLAEREEALEAAKKALEEGDIQDAEEEMDGVGEEEEEEPESESPEEKEQEGATEEQQETPPSEGVNLNINVNHKSTGPVNMNIDVETSMEKQEEEAAAEGGEDAAEMKAGNKILRQLYKSYYPGSHVKVPGPSKAAQAKHRAHRMAMKADGSSPKKAKLAAVHAKHSPSQPAHSAKWSPSAAQGLGQQHSHAAKPEGTFDFNFLGFGVKLAANVTWQPGAAAWYAYLPEDDRTSGAERMGLSSGVLSSLALLVSLLVLRCQV